MKTTSEPIPLEQLPALGRGLAERLEAPLTVTVEGEAVAIMLAVDDFARLLREREVLRRLALGDLEFAGGEGHSLDEVLEDCDLLLNES